MLKLTRIYSTSNLTPEFYQCLRYSNMPKSALRIPLFRYNTLNTRKYPSFKVFDGRYSESTREFEFSINRVSCYCTDRKINLKSKNRLSNGPGLEYFIANSGNNVINSVNDENNNQEKQDKRTYSKRELEKLSHPYVSVEDVMGHNRKVHFEVHGCQMNVSDAEVAWSILQTHGYVRARDVSEADVVLLVTCSIREGAERKIWNKIDHLRGLKKRRLQNKSSIPLKIGVLGCMAERLKKKLIEKDRTIDVVAGPDSYRDLPRLLALVRDDESAVNVLLSAEETYADIVPLSLSQNRISAFVNVMRGCDNMCTYCIVPHTRGRERSRPIASILDEIRFLSDQGVKEVTLLGQNVNSYRDVSSVSSASPSLVSEEPSSLVFDTPRDLAYRDMSSILSVSSRLVSSEQLVSEPSPFLAIEAPRDEQTFSGSPRLPTDALRDEKTSNSRGFKTIYKPKIGGIRFADLLHRASEIDPDMRIRFTSPHPKDFPDEVLQVISEKDNLCKNIHLPAQCGSNRILELMRRGYTKEAYLDLVQHIRSIIPNVSLSSDFICGFCSETEDEFQETLDLIRQVKYNYGFLFPYSMREKTAAHRKLVDDVPQTTKLDRLRRMVEVFRNEADTLNRKQIGQKQLVLVEGKSKRSDVHLAGRNDGNIKVIFPRVEVEDPSLGVTRHAEVGEYVAVVITDANSQVLKGVPKRISSIRAFLKDKYEV